MKSKKLIVGLLIMPILVFATTIYRSSEPANLETGAWRKYASSKYRFELSYPPGSHVAVEDPNYIRIQNYEPTDDSTLKSGTYYVEIHIKDLSDSCKGWVQKKPMKIAVGNVPATIGIGSNEGDAGGIRFILCAKRKSDVFVAVATEDHMSGPIANRILRSIKFSD